MISIQDKLRGCLVGGAITGNIMGALLGYGAIEAKWLEKLELHGLILKMADALYEKRYG